MTDVEFLEGLEWSGSNDLSGYPECPMCYAEAGMVGGRVVGRHWEECELKRRLDAARQAATNVDEASSHTSDSAAGGATIGAMSPFPSRSV